MTLPATRTPEPVRSVLQVSEALHAWRIQRSRLPVLSIRTILPGWHLGSFCEACQSAGARNHVTCRPLDSAESSQTGIWVRFDNRAGAEACDLCGLPAVGFGRIV